MRISRRETILQLLAIFSPVASIISTLRTLITPPQRAATIHEQASSNDVYSRADLKAVPSPANDQVAFLSDGAASGRFRFSAANLNAEVSIDRLGGFYVAPDHDDSGASGAWVRQPENTLFDIRWCGCVADSAGLNRPMGGRTHKTDNSAALRQAIVLAARLDMDLWIPPATSPGLFFSLDDYVRLEPRTRIFVEGALVNGNTGGGQNSMLFRPGNFHPAYLDRGGASTITTYPCGSPAVATTKVACTVRSDAGRFAVGDQLCVLSDATGAVPPYRTSCYIHPATVTAVDVGTGTISFDAPMSFGALSCSVVPLKTLPARTIDGVIDHLFFWSGRIYGPGRLESEHHSLWSDSAIVDAEITGVRSHARRSVGYGNLIVRSRIHDFTSYCSEAFSEFSQGSHRTKFYNADFYYKPTLAKISHFFGLNLGGDHAREIEAYDLRVHMEGMPGGSAVLGLSLAQNCHVHDIRLNVGVRGANQPLIFIGTSAPPSASFTMSGNVIERVKATGISSGYFCWIDGNNSDYFFNNTVRDVDVRISLTGSNGYSIYVRRCKNSNTIERFNYNGQGRLRVDSSVRQHIDVMNTATRPASAKNP